MKSEGLMQRMDDAINPIVVKELRQAVHSRFVTWVILLFLALQLLIVGIYLFLAAAQGRTESVEFQGGRESFTALQVLLLSTCMLFLPIYTGVRLMAERNELNTDLLFITTLKPRAIISGKLVSAVVLALMIFSSCAPFMMFTFFLRGIDLPSILFILSIDFIVVIGSVQFMVFLAVVNANRVLKMLLGLIGLGWLISIFSMTLSATMALLWAGIPVLEEDGFWLAAGAVALGIVGLSGLFFTWSVALISPPSSNRAWPVRLYLFVFWLVSGVVMTYISYKVRFNMPFGVWIVIMSAAWSLQLIISINEREHWTPRVRTSIPQRWWLRVPAFFLFSGAAGGVLFGTVMMGLTVLAYQQFLLWSSSYGWFTTRAHRADDLTIVFNISAIGFVYAFGYCLSAVFLRDRLMRFLSPGYTWLVLLVLVAAASLLPLVFSMLLSFRNWRYDESYLWLLPNPAVAIAEFAEPRHFHRQDVFVLFAGIWSIVVLLINVPWFFRQVRGFRHLPEQHDPFADRPPTALAMAGSEQAP